MNRFEFELLTQQDSKKNFISTHEPIYMYIQFHKKYKLTEFNTKYKVNNI